MLRDLHRLWLHSHMLVRNNTRSLDLRRFPSLHGSHTPSEEILLLYPMLLLLLTHLAFDLPAEWHLAIDLIAMLGMETTQSNELLANGTSTICLSLACLGVLNHTLHLGAAWHIACRLTAVRSMDK